MKFVNLGEKRPENLNYQLPIVYKSESLISSMSYSGDASKIEKSTSFTSTFKRELVCIEGQVSLGSTGGNLRNVHVYSRKATYLDGIERICYLQQANDKLVVSEYSGNRGAKYSSLYPVLKNELKKKGFEAETNGTFKFDEADISKFVKILNMIINKRDSEEYELVAVDEVDSIVINKQQYYYYKAYWQDKVLPNLVNVSDNAGDLLANDIEKVLKYLVNYSKCCDDTTKLSKLESKIDKLSKVISARIKNLEEFEELNSAL